MNFIYNGRLTCLKRLTSTCCGLIDDREFCRISKMEHNGLLLQLIISESQQSIIKDCDSVSKLLEQVLKFFEEFKGLPPQRTHNHQILLKEETLLVSVRPYHYPYYKKGEIEKIFRRVIRI